MQVNSREKINKIFEHCGAERVGFWSGNPLPVTLEAYLNQLGLKSAEDFFKFLDDDCRWIAADSGYKQTKLVDPFHPLYGKTKDRHGQTGLFGDCESINAIADYPWPDCENLNFTDILNKLDNYQDRAVFTGMWSDFFHKTIDFFGFENFFVKMYTNPEVVKAVITRIVDFYCAANDRFFKELGERADFFFFGNDFGTQQDLMMSLQHFEEFVLPGIIRLVEVAKSYEKKVILHSCGAVSRVIPLLIKAGVDALHPVQSGAQGMKADLLQQYCRDIIFIGGIDTQDLLVNAEPDEIKEEVFRMIDILGPDYIVSPSHEALLPDIPLKNILALRDAVAEYNNYKK